MVYRGPNLLLGYQDFKHTSDHFIAYPADIAFGAVFNKGAGFSRRFRPLVLTHEWNLRSTSLTIGGYLASDYQWQQYLELQGGRLFWFSTIEMGPTMIYRLPLKKYQVYIHLANSLIGISSRPAPSTESHFYAFNFSEFVSVAHRNIRFGTLNDIQDLISLYFGNDLGEHMDKSSITIQDLLTMRSGIDYDNGEQTDDLLQQIPENSLAFVLSRPIISPPGSSFHYIDGNPHLLSPLLQTLIGQPTDKFAERHLFSPLELTNYHWIRYKDGITLGGFGIETTPRELGKIALCVAARGTWKGRQIISKNWVEAMTTVQTTIENSPYSFGYFWWVDETRGIPFMWGVGGQFAFIVPSKALVIIMTSFPNTKGENEIQADEALQIVDQIILAAN